MGQDHAFLRTFGKDAIRLLKPVWPLVAFATVLGSVSGLAAAGALSKINEAFYGDSRLTQDTLLAFLGLAAMGVVGTFASSIGNRFAGERVQAALKRDLIDKILTAPVERVETIGKHKLLASLQSDASTIYNTVSLFSPVVIAGGTLIGCCAYMIAMSPTLSAVTAIVLTLEAFAENALRRSMHQNFKEARQNAETIQKHYLTVIEAAKELRISRERRLRLRNVDLRGCIEAGRQIGRRIVIVMESMSVLSQATNFMLFGGLIAYKIMADIDGAELSGFVLVLLYIQGPISQLVHFVPEIAKVQIAYRRIAEFSDETTTAEPDLLTLGPTAAAARTFSEIALRGVSHSFPSVGEKAPFTLGPLDLTVRAGEIVFIVGENGSGKTTLIKLLLGLYPPQQGEIRLDGVPVTAETRDEYRQHFSAIFFDYHLFADLIVPDGTRVESVEPFLEKLDLAHKVAIVGDRFTTTDLSTGQRKRLALIQVLLEGRPVLVLDEWAAEQDPTFRRRFYTELLPDLQRQGRTLIVISHDDRYFDAADRVIHLRDGKIAEIANKVIEAA